MPKSFPAAIALGALGLLIGSPRSNATATAAPGPTPSGGPTDYHRSARAYAAAKLPALRSRWADARINAALRAYAPQLLPGLPLAAALALGASSQGPTENTGGELGERGLFNVETHYIDSWASDDATRAALRRAYDPSVAAYAADLEAQVYTGLRRYRAALDSLSAAAAYRVPLDALAAWAMVASYSSGPAAWSDVATLASTTRDATPAAICAAVDAAATAGQSTIAGLPVTGKAHAAWTCARPLQRYYAGQLLAAAVDPSTSAWWTLAPVPDAVDVRLSALAHGGRT